MAGKRAGLKHEANGDEETTRSGLFMDAVRIIKEMREATNGKYPTFAVWENVPGAFSSNEGEDFRTVLEELIKIVEPTAVMPAVPKNGWPYADSYCGDGWSLAYRVFDAQYWGVPQRRRRVYLILDLRGQRAGKVSFEREGLRGNFATFKTAGQGTAGDAANRTGADDCEGEGNCLTPWNVQSRRIFSVDGPWPALYGGEGGGHGYACVPHTLKIRSGCEGGGKGARADDYQRKCVGFPLGFRPENIRIYEETATKICNGTRPGFCNGVIVSYDARGNGAGQTVNTLTGDHENRITDYTSVVCMAHGHASVRVQYIVRRLTPTECARLQGFPDDWGHPDHKEDFTDEEYRFWLNVRNTHAAINGKPQKDYTKTQMLTWYNKLHTDSSEYKMYGNGIALPCALYVMQGIKAALIHDGMESDNRIRITKEEK